MNSVNKTILLEGDNLLDRLEEATTFLPIQPLAVDVSEQILKLVKEARESTDQERINAIVREVRMALRTYNIEVT